MRLIVVLAVLIASGLPSRPALAQADAAPVAVAEATPVAPPPAAEPDIASLETIVVTGAQPGPGLWRVSRGSHVLWILGTLSPLPRDMTWLSADVEATIAGSEVALASPGVDFDADVGFFGRLALLPSLVKVRNNTDDKTLDQVLPPDLYARWQDLKAKYIGRSRKVEKWRPLFAAGELYRKALDKQRLTESGQIGKVVSKAIKQHGITKVDTHVKVKIEEPRAAIKAFKAEELDDVECLRQVLDRLEADLATMTARANAWAVGDVDALRTLPHDSPVRTCFAAIAETSFARERGIDDLPERVEAAWLAAAEAALRDHETSFATLSIGDLLKPDGLLAKLVARGYEVEAP
ncbi:TraB/GumN family protein [Dokdonella koreensis]|uniref:GumN protein n=1 Tax=Dokdonella koreensis DS-123 TaxID=1300342 RepID=A0A167GB15_9GAMM|nr:TraB/GumN family protein [Dokdonella koreensis]ANB16358.1 GumN protein [Dokdonella koreensis DS-123]